MLKARPTAQAALLLMGLILMGLMLAGRPAGAQQALVLETKIPLGAVAGRIDHMAIDIARQHLIVAELGNDTVGIVDVAAGKVIQRIHGLKEPQGLGYVASTDTIYVANAGDGSVRLFSGADFSPTGSIALGDDADDVRVNEQVNEVIVGYGEGGLAIIDPKRRTKVGDIRLKAHPEAFEITKDARRIFVNVPNAHEIAVVDRAARRQVASWPLAGASANFPMALDEAGGQLVVVTRRPAKVFVLAADSGGTAVEVDTCGDADDVFFHSKRHRIYVSCGSGAVDVIALSKGAYHDMARVPTVVGGRTSLFVPQLDRLFVAVRARGAEPAAIWVFRPIS